MKKQRSAAEGKANEEWKVKDKKPSKWKGSGYEEQEWLWINHASPAPYIQTASTDVHVQPRRPIRPFLRPDRIRRGHRQNTKRQYRQIQYRQDQYRQRQYRQIRPIPLIIHSWNFAWSLKLHLILFCRTKKYNYLCTRKCACGGIGRRARLRIWCLATCRFESYQAHHTES